MNACELGTVREACARAVEWMGRGHVAHEHAFLLTLVPELRALPLESSGAAQVAAANAFMCGQRWRKLRDDEKRLLGSSMIRINDEVVHRLDDPMEIYSDRDKWWPHVRIAL